MRGETALTPMTKKLWEQREIEFPYGIIRWTEQEKPPNGDKHCQAPAP